MFGQRNSAYAVNLTYDRHTDTYISCKISIEHPSVGLASLPQLVKHTTNDTGTRTCSHLLEHTQNSSFDLGSLHQVSYCACPSWPRKSERLSVHRRLSLTSPLSLQIAVSGKSCLDKSSALVFSDPGLYLTSKSNRCREIDHLCSLGLSLFMVLSFVKALWSVCSINRLR